MKQARAKSISITQVSKAVRVPKHPLKPRLQRVLEVVDGVHSPRNLKPVAVVMNPFVRGAVFDAYTGTGPYTIELNPNGNHPELSLLHEVGHFLEWQAIPKVATGQRDFTDYPLFTSWLSAIRASQDVDRLLSLRDSYPAESETHQAADYLLDEQELWARSYSQYAALKTQMQILLQQISAENKVLTGKIYLKPYWEWDDFAIIKVTMDSLFQALSWSK